MNIINIKMLLYIIKINNKERKNIEYKKKNNVIS